jgi:competence protein ComGC
MDTPLKAVALIIGVLIALIIPQLVLQLKNNEKHGNQEPRTNYDACVEHNTEAFILTGHERNHAFRIAVSFCNKER